MAKIDCSTVIGFAQESNRVCNMHEHCDTCPFSGKKQCPLAVFEFDNPDVQGIIDNLQKWSDEHQPKTRLDDILEKSPHIELNRVDKVPYIRPFNYGYCKDCNKCTLSAKASVATAYCWNEPLDGGATGIK